jgi:hypothetical protein
MGELHILYQLQQVEANLDNLRRKLKELPVYAEFKKIQQEVADMRESVGWAESKLEEQRKRLRRFEQDLQKTEQESKDVQATLYSGTISQAKELEQLEIKSKALVRDREKEEENMLLAMEAAEDVEKALLQSNEKLSALTVKLREVKQRGNEEIRCMKEEISGVEKSRDELVGQVSEKLLSDYRDMFPRFHGRPLARVKGDICEGCRVSLSSHLVNRLCNPQTVVHCENCGRILVSE